MKGLVTPFILDAAFMNIAFLFKYALPESNMLNMFTRRRPNSDKVMLNKYHHLCLLSMDVWLHPIYVGSMAEHL